jgi:hypothetical protein
MAPEKKDQISRRCRSDFGADLCDAAGARSAIGSEADRVAWAFGFLLGAEDLTRAFVAAFRGLRGVGAFTLAAPRGVAVVCSGLFAFVAWGFALGFLEALAFFTAMSLFSESTVCVAPHGRVLGEPCQSHDVPALR